MRRKFFFIGLACFVLFFVLSTPIFRFAEWTPSHEAPKENAEVLTADEINAFLALWPEYLQTNEAQKGLQQVSLSNAQPSESFSPSLVRWFKRKGWDINRFFYIEQRLKAIIKTGLLLENIEATKKIMQISSDTGQLQQIIEMQREQINAEKISRKELDIVLPSLHKIQAILENGNS